MRQNLILFFMTNCFIQIFCDINEEKYITRSSELIDKVRNDKTDIEGVFLVQ